jgi:hypothetical protein
MREMNHIDAIRLISGKFTQEIKEMGDRLSIINLLARNLVGDAEDDFTNETMKKLGIKLIRNKGN